MGQVIHMTDFLQRRLDQKNQKIQDLNEFLEGWQANVDRLIADMRANGIAHCPSCANLLLPSNNCSAYCDTCNKDVPL
jgi:hypothetical protein